jgi:hypothetical protein
MPCGVQVYPLAETVREKLLEIGPLIDARRMISSSSPRPPVLVT